MLITELKAYFSPTVPAKFPEGWSLKAAKQVELLFLNFAN
jgi:hypothetical protein